jgi:hypothetical protein
MLRDPKKGYLIEVCQRKEGIQASRGDSWAIECLECSLAVREDENPLISIRPYIFICTLQNGINCSLKNCGIFNQREAVASIWSKALYSGPSPRVNSRAVSIPDQNILGKRWDFGNINIAIYRKPTETVQS